MTPPSPTPQVRYRVVVHYEAASTPVLLDAEDVVAWVVGFATALGQQHHLDALADNAAEDTRRVQALQIGHAQGWFDYLYPEPPDRPYAPDPAATEG